MSHRITSHYIASHHITSHLTYNIHVKIYCMHIIIIDMNHIYQKWHHFSGSWFHGFAMALGRPFRDVGTALVLRIELTAGHFVVPLVTLPPNVVLLSSQEKNQNMKKEEEGGNKAQQDTSLRLHPIDLKLCVYTYIHISVIIYCILSNSYILVCMYVYYIYISSQAPAHVFLADCTQ